jgi:NADH/NAD ratio-sensing transcriptional regulator Rex
MDIASTVDCATHRHHPDQILSFKEAAAFLGVSQATLRRREIPVVRLGDRRRGYRVQTLVDYIRANEG